MTLDELLFNSGFSPAYGEDCIRIMWINNLRSESIFDGTLDDLESSYANLLTCIVDRWYPVTVNGTHGLEIWVDGTDDEIYPFGEEEYV